MHTNVTHEESILNIVVNWYDEGGCFIADTALYCGDIAILSNLFIILLM